MNNAKHAPKGKLDPTKLLGFRNLVPVVAGAEDLRRGSEVAFSKIGTTETA